MLNDIVLLLLVMIGFTAYVKIPYLYNFILEKLAIIFTSGLLIKLMWRKYV